MTDEWKGKQWLIFPFYNAVLSCLLLTAWKGRSKRSQPPRTLTGDENSTWKKCIAHGSRTKEEMKKNKIELHKTFLWIYIQSFFSSFFSFAEYRYITSKQSIPLLLLHTCRHACPLLFLAEEDIFRPPTFSPITNDTAEFSHISGKPNNKVRASLCHAWLLYLEKNWFKNTKSRGYIRFLYSSNIMQDNHNMTHCSLTVP